MGRFGADSQMLAATMTPHTRLQIQNARGEISSPARCRRRRIETFSRVFWRSSSSFSVSETWRRRFWATSAWALAATRLVLLSVTPWMRLSVRRSPEK